MNEEAKGLEFPCEFPIKVFMRADSDFAPQARQIVERHTGKLGDDRVSGRASSGAKFLAVTFTVTASSRAQLDEIYTDLTAHKEILMAL